MTYIEIQNEVVKKYRIDLCDGTKCKDGDWSRTHAHVKLRRICKWKQANSVQSTFTLFHEIGHIETTKANMRAEPKRSTTPPYGRLMSAKNTELNCPQKLLKNIKTILIWKKTGGCVEVVRFTEI